MYRAFISIVLAFLTAAGCSGGGGDDGGDGSAGAGKIPDVTHGPYRACSDADITDPGSGCSCSGTGATPPSSVCRPDCTSVECPAAPASGPAAVCTAAQFSSHCDLPCVEGKTTCAPGYTCVSGVCAVAGPPVSDVAARYDSTTPEPAMPATPIGATQQLCGSPLVLAGELTDADPPAKRSLRTSGGCVASPYSDPQDVYSIELVGPGPHRLDFDSCGAASFPMELMLFQKPGSSSPYDTTSTCANMITSWEPSAQPNCNGGIFARTINLEPGIIYVVVSSESGERGTYSLTITSDTSSCR